MAVYTGLLAILGVGSLATSMFSPIVHAGGPTAWNYLLGPGLVCFFIGVALSTWLGLGLSSVRVKK